LIALVVGQGGEQRVFGFALCLRGTGEASRAGWRDGDYVPGRGVPTRTGKAVWDRSSVWGMLRNTAYHGQAAFGKTKTLERHGKPTRTTRARGDRHGRRAAREDQPAEKWTLIAVPALVSEETFERAQARLAHNAHFAKRNTKKPTSLQGILVCHECGYGCYRSSTRTTNKRIYYYRCIGSDNYRHIGGRVCHSRPIRADELDGLVWEEVRRLLEDPTLVRAEIDRRLTALRTEHPAARRRESLELDLTRAGGAIERLIEAYQEQLLSLDELRARMPTLRKRQSTLRAQLDTLDTELHDAETYLKLADSLEGFLGRLADGLDQLSLEEQQRVLRLVVREVVIGGGDDTITIRHTIPTPTRPNDPSYLLRGSSRQPAALEHRPARDGERWLVANHTAITTITVPMTGTTGIAEPRLIHTDCLTRSHPAPPLPPTPTGLCLSRMHRKVHVRF
jgi:site-specific DNA recombinase